MRHYTRWIIIAIIIIALAVLTAFFSVRSNRVAPSPTPSPTPTSSSTSSPVATASLSPTASPDPTPTATASESTISHKAKAEAAYKAKDYETAVAEYTAAIKAENESGELTTLWNSLGNAERDSGDTASAITAYTTSLLYNTKNGDAYLNKAALQWSLGNREEAKTTLRDGIQKEATRQQDLQNTLSVYEALPQ